MDDRNRLRNAFWKFGLVRMGCLNQIENWPELARTAQYDSTALAELCRISARQLRRHFESAFGRAPRQWLDELRLWDAARLLCSGLRVKEVTFRLNFKNVSHFCHRFGRYHGCTPAQFVAWHRHHEERRRRQNEELLGGELLPPEWLGIPPWTQAERNLRQKLPT